MRELPISEERLAELREPLSNEGRMALELLFSIHRTEDFDEDNPPENSPAVQEYFERLDALSDDDQKQMHYITQEIRRAYDRRIAEDESVSDLGRRAMVDIAKAQEFDTSVRTLNEALPILKANSITSQVSDEELEVEIEVPAEEEFEWISMPTSEMDVDENGIPTKSAARDGWALPNPDGSALIKLDAKETQAMRLYAQNYPYKQYVDNNLDEAREMVRELRGDLSGMGLEESYIEQQAKELTNAVLYKSYLQTIALEIKEIQDPQGFIDYRLGKNTAAARRHKTELEEAARDFVGQAVEEGLLEVKIGEDGKEYVKPGPSYSAWKKKMEEEVDDEREES